MSLSIRTNIASLDAQRNLNTTQSALDTSIARLSSGFRITKAGDDAAGLGISSSLEAQYNSYNQAVRNANDGLSVVQSAEAGFNEISNIVSRLRELAMEAANDTLGTSERGYIDTEVKAQTAEIDRIANSAEFNGQKLLNGTNTTFNFQVGIHAVAANDTVTVQGVDARSSALFGATLDMTSQSGATTALGYIDTAISNIAKDRASFGAAGNRLQNVVNVVQSFAEATAAANSRIKDVDVAQETSALARSQILAQSGISVLAQANQLPQMALKLLG